MKKLITLILAASLTNVSAAFLDDVGFSQLQMIHGVGLADGSGVLPTLVEARVNVGEMLDVWAPDPTNADISDVTFIDKTPIPAPLAGLYSPHATSTAIRMAGTSGSMTPGVASVEVYDATDWLINFLQVDSMPEPLASASRIANHSWVGDFGQAPTSDPDLNIDALQRVDWLVERDEFVQVVGNTNGSPIKPLLANAYNVIAVGRTDGSHSTGSLDLDANYVADRANPHLVAPLGSSSSATAVATSAATLLIDTAHQKPSLSLEPDRTPRHAAAQSIRSAETSEVIKALLMAGADRSTQNPTAANITDYRQGAVNQTQNGLDTRFGAGQLNINTSYEILIAGEQNSLEDGGGSVLWSGFDYDPEFGGADSSNDVANYLFSTAATAARLTVALVWNLSVDDGGAFDPDPILHNLDLELWMIDGPTETMISGSFSAIDNTENLWTNLDPDSNFALRVVNGGGTDFNWDYGLAWQLQAVPLPAALPMMAFALAGLGMLRFRQVVY